MNALVAIVDRARRLDARLLAVSPRTQYIVIALTVAVMVATSLPHVPRAWLDYSTIPVLSRIQQPSSYGPDTLSDHYGGKVVLNDPLDMYTRTRLEQTPEEAAVWSKEEAAPYPPAVLLADAAFYALGERTGIKYYGFILGLACVFIALSIVYFVRTRWYLFPLLYLNFSYFSYRFVYVQDNSYLMMLVVIIAALFLARAGRPLCHALVALAIVLKLSPMYYVKNIVSMKRSVAILFAAILVAGLVLPYFIWDNYLYIYQFGNENKGDRWYDLAGALALAVPFSALLWYVETRLHFDTEDRIGWSLIPLAIFFAVKMNAARHLMIVLLVPDKRGVRNVAAAVGLALHALFPGVIRFNSVMYITIALLLAALFVYLRQIGWNEVRDDVRHPLRTARQLLAETSLRT